MTYAPLHENKKELKETRRELRKNMTKAEKFLWYKIRNKQLGYKFRRQFSINNYVVDFFCYELKIIIELDGWVHGEEKVICKDTIRQKYLEGKGYSVIRYDNEQVLKSIESVLSDLQRTCQEKEKILSLTLNPT